MVGLQVRHSGKSVLVRTEKQTCFSVAAIHLQRGRAVKAARLLRAARKRSKSLDGPPQRRVCRVSGPADHAKTRPFVLNMFTPVIYVRKPPSALERPTVLVRRPESSNSLVFFSDTVRYRSVANGNLSGVECRDKPDAKQRARLPQGFEPRICWPQRKSSDDLAALADRRRSRALKMTRATNVAHASRTNHTVNDCRYKK